MGSLRETAFGRRPKARKFLSSSSLQSPDSSLYARIIRVYAPTKNVMMMTPMNVCAVFR